LELTGIHSAVVTPMKPDGSLDEPGMVRLLAHIRTMELPGVVIAGSTGEGPSLAAVEKRDLVRLARSTNPELLVTIGIATASLTEAVWLCEQSRKAGAVAGLVMPPAFFREVDGDAIAEWFESLFHQTTLPILLYNFPLRAGRAFSPELLSRLTQHDQCMGVKDSSGAPENLASFRQAISQGKSLLVGDERLLLDARKAGWTGSISGSSNVIGHWLKTIWESPEDQSEHKFELIRDTLGVLRQPNLPARAKYILERQGIIDHATVRLPLHGAELTVAEWQAVQPSL
jgi:4-hydroxy-tetrahydrodipicolinate synthase